MQPPPESFERALARLNAEVREAFNRGDVQRCVAAYAEDAILLLADREPVEGRKAIESYLRELAGSGAKLVSIDPIAIRSAAGMGCCAGTYEFVAPSMSGERISRRGKFVTVFMRQADGSWKAVVDTLLGE